MTRPSEACETTGTHTWTPPPRPRTDQGTASVHQKAVHVADMFFRIGARRSLHDFVLGGPDFSPALKAVRADPKRLLNPMDLFLEICRPDYFRKAEFDARVGDPGWFGPESAAWYVFSHAPTVVLGLINTAIVDIMHQGIQAAVFDHSKLPGRDEDGKAIPGTVSSVGLAISSGHTGAFFVGVPLGSTRAAEALCRTVREMHHKVKGVRPDGVPYDADDPEFFRWTYCTIVHGFGQAHERYHPKPLKGRALDEYYREYTKVGEALGGTDLPATKAAVEDCLKNSPCASDVIVNQGNIGYVNMIPKGMRGGGVGWMIQDILCEPVQKALGFQQPNPVLLFGYRRFARAAALLLNASSGDTREAAQAYRRVGLAKEEGYRRAYKRLNTLGSKE
jgi:hypothetical protein